ncbi:MAG: HEAT repeat domain-containing protein, partial [bacterium]
LLHGLLGAEEAPLRRAACAALGHHPDLRARAPAEALLTDEDPRVQVAAARALLGIGGYGRRPPALALQCAARAGRTPRLRSRPCPPPLPMPCRAGPKSCASATSRGTPACSC